MKTYKLLLLLILFWSACSEDFKPKTDELEIPKMIQKDIDNLLSSKGFSSESNNGLVTYNYNGNDIELYILRKEVSNILSRYNYSLNQVIIEESRPAENTRVELVDCTQYTETFYDGGGCFLDVVYYECDGEFSTISVSNCWRCWFGLSFEGCNSF
jgi:hypothetical protein